MGKPSKRKNPGVGVDFRKVKHKVGKKLPKARNDTTTDFQSRSINLPNQSLTQDKAGAAVSERNLTLKELVSQLSHHNTHTRRDALNGLQQLLTTHPAEGRRHTAVLLEALATRVADGEQSVRTALLALLRSAAFPAVGATALTPFVPIFMAHLSAALTHLSADVRLDALAVLEALTEAVPHLMATDTMLCSSLAHYTGLLSRANRGKSVKSQALTGLLKVMSSLQRFLGTATAAAAAVQTAATSNDTAVGSEPSSSSAAMHASGGSDSSTRPLLAARTAAPPAESMRLPSPAEMLRLYVNSTCLPSNSSSSSITTAAPSQQPQRPGAGNTQPALSSKQAAVTSASSGSGSAAAQLQMQALQLLSVLFECWSEAAPSSLSTAPEQEGAQGLVHILACCQLLLAHIAPADGNAVATASTADVSDVAAVAAGSSRPGVNSSSTSGLCPGFTTLSSDRTLWLNQAAAVVLPKLLKVFPVVASAGTVSASLQELLQRFNLLSVQLLAGFMAGGVVWPAATGKQGSSSSVAAVVAQQEWQVRLLSFMADVLHTGSCLPTSAMTSLQQQPTGAPAGAGAASKMGNKITSSTDKQKRHQTAQNNSNINSSNSNSSSHVLTVLKCLQLLLPQLPPEPRQQLLSAVEQLLAAPHTTAASQQQAATSTGDYNNNSSNTAQPVVTGAVRTACQQLQLQLMVRYLLDAVPDAVQEAAVARWVAAAPKLLWECSTLRPHVSSLLLQMLHQAGCLAQPGTEVQQQLQQVQPQLAALLATALPVGSMQHSKKRKQQQQGQGSDAVGAAAVPVLVGPVAVLPKSVQALACDTLCFLPEVQAPLLKAIALSCRLSSYNDAAVARLLDAVLYSASTHVAPDQYLSFIATLLTPPHAGGYVDRANGAILTAHFSRHQLVVDAVCRWLHTYGPVQELLPLLAPVVAQQHRHMSAAASSSSANAWRCSSYSCISLAALAVGCWRPGSWPCSSSSSSSPSDVAVELVPQQLVEILPAALTAYVAASIAAEGSKEHARSAVAAAGAGAGEGQVNSATERAALAVMFSTVGQDRRDAVSKDVAVVDDCLLTVMPLLAALPSLLLPFMEGITCEFVEGSGSSSGKLSGNSLAVAVHVWDVVLNSQALKRHITEHEQQVQQLASRMVAAGQRLQQEGADVAVIAEVQKLQAGVSVLFGR